MSKSRLWAESKGIQMMREQNITVFSDTNNSDSEITFRVLANLFLALICCISSFNLVLIQELLNNYFSKRSSKHEINVMNINTNSK